MNYSIIILAAGSSSRMGVPKLLLKINGQSLIRKITLEALETNAKPVTVVVGAHKELIIKELEKLPVNIIVNKDWATGMAGSIKMGMVGSYLINKEFEKVLITTADCPEINAKSLESVLEKAEKSDKNIIFSSYLEVKGIPAVIKKRYFEDLLQLKGDIGLKQLSHQYKDDYDTIELPEAGLDLDTKEQYLAYLMRL